MEFLLSFLSTIDATLGGGDPFLGSADPKVWIMFWLFDSHLFSKVLKICLSSAIPSLDLIFLTEDWNLLNLFFPATLLSGFGIIFIFLLLYYIIWNYYFSNSSLELGEACSVAADCGDPQALWILLWRCQYKTSLIVMTHRLSFYQCYKDTINCQGQ